MTERLSEAKSALTDAEFPAGDLAKIFSNEFEETAGVAAVRAWVSAAGNASPFRTPLVEKPWLVLIGGVGSGKSFAAGYAFRELGSRWTTFAAAPRLAAKIDPWQGEDRSERVNADSVLVLDDLGTEKDANGRFGEAFLRVLNARADYPLIITSNLPKAEWRKRYDERAISRLNHRARVVEIATKSLRSDGAL